MKLISRIAALAFLAAVMIGCGNDKVADANKNLKTIDPNAPKPSAATGAGPGGGAGAGGDAGKATGKPL